MVETLTVVVDSGHAKWWLTLKKDHEKDGTELYRAGGSRNYRRCCDTGFREQVRRFGSTH